MKKKIIICAIFLLLLAYVFLTPTFAKYVIEEKIQVATIKIDRTPPNVEIEYLPNEKTQEKVEVTITADEEIEEPDGWVLQEDGRTLKKEYKENTKEEVEITDKSGNTRKETIEVTNIDNKAPTVEIKSISNSNTEYPNYANKEAQITATILVKDDQKIAKSLKNEDIKILINNIEISPKRKEILIQKDTDIEKQILLTVSGIEEEGNLSIKIPNNTVKDEAENVNVEAQKNTNIHIDNTKPQATYSQEIIEQGKVEAKITANEDIRKLDGWNIENNSILKKVFKNNLCYTTFVQDLAGNKTDVKVNIIRATNVLFSYASYNDTVGWSIAYGNDDIAGLNAVKKNPKYKSESLAFSIMGNIESDYLQGRGYVYTYWKEGSKAMCEYTNKIYSHGWNPNENGWIYRNSETKITLWDERNYFQIGGAGINKQGNTDINGNNSIPSNVANEYYYGVSAVQLKLKSYEENSICYQIYVDTVGWITPAKNGELTCYNIQKPISAIRVALVPNSEVEALINTWNQDIRKNYQLNN